MYSIALYAYAHVSSYCMFYLGFVVSGLTSKIFIALYLYSIIIKSSL
jgi:hypothetical protein